MASSGPNNPGTSGSAALSGSTYSWTNTGNILSSDNSYSRVDFVLNNTFSNYLTATNFGFSIPGGSTIDGIVVEVEKKGTAFSIIDQRARIIKGGVIGSTAREDQVNAWASSDTYKTYGSSSDKWGETWTDSDINASTFGFAISAFDGGGTNRFAEVDHIRITVYYTAGATGNPKSVTRGIMLTGPMRRVVL